MRSTDTLATVKFAITFRYTAVTRLERDTQTHVGHDLYRDLVRPKRAVQGSRTGLIKPTRQSHKEPNTRVNCRQMRLSRNLMLRQDPSPVYNHLSELKDTQWELTIQFQCLGRPFAPTDEPAMAKPSLEGSSPVTPAAAPVASPSTTNDDEVTWMNRMKPKV